MNAKRIDSIDALRGFAIAGIILLHNLEHFDFMFFPETLSPMIKTLDKHVWHVVEFFFAGKAYAIFALLFGFSFFLMDNKQREIGNDFRLRFMWRLLILLGFGFVNSLLYEGDILTYYATLGVALVLVCRLSTPWILAISALLLLQPLALYRLYYFSANPTAEPIVRWSHHYFEQSFPYLSGESFWELIKGNCINGRLAVLHWSWEKGRFFQAPALFMLGFLLGRHGRFIVTADNKRFWYKVLISSIIVAIPLFWARENIAFFSVSKLQKPSLSLLFYSYYNFAFMFAMVSVFVIAFRQQIVQRILDPLRWLGRMSLTNYLMQSMIGAVTYYGFGAGLYEFTGATYSLAIGLLMLFLQILFCKWWLKNHAQGPLEYVWHKATWMNFGTKGKR